MKNKENNIILKRYALSLLTEDLGISEDPPGSGNFVRSDMVTQQTQNQSDTTNKPNQVLTIIEQNLKSLEMQSNTLVQNGKQIRVLINQIRQLAQNDPTIKV